MWKYWESNHAQQIHTDVMISHWHAVWEDLLHYCIDCDWDIDLESTLSPKGLARLHTMIIVDTVAKMGGLWSCKHSVGSGQSECHGHPSSMQTMVQGGQKPRPLQGKLIWKDDKSSERSKKEARDHVSPGRDGLTTIHPLGAKWTFGLYFIKFSYFFQ